MDTLRGPADPLGEALQFLRLDRSFYSRGEFTAPWGIELPRIDDSLMFHVVTSGCCWLEVDGEEPVELRPGTLAFVPHGEGHRLVSELGTRATPLSDVPPADGTDHYEVLRILQQHRYRRHQEVAHATDHYEVLRMGNGGDLTTMLCGVIWFDHPATRSLIEALPHMIAVDVDDSLQRDWMSHTIRLLDAEASHLRPGGESVITRLADVLVIQAIRAWIEASPAARTGWLGALRDPQIGRAIAMVHRTPEHDWTVASLASKVAMSRSAFAERFTDLVGETPMRYVTRWRMYLAMETLRAGATAAEVSGQTGYQSEAAFSRAFKRFTGEPPGAFRRGAEGRARLSSF